MRWFWSSGALMIVLFVAAPAARAERAPEDRSKATHVVVGTVESVYVREEKGTRHYLIVVAVEQVEKGEGVRPGQAFYVAAYLWNPDFEKGKKLTEAEEKELTFRGAAYNGVPKEGERVRVYAKHDAVYANGRPGRYSGVYPDWYEVVKRKAE